VGSDIIVEKLTEAVGTKIEMTDVYLVADGDEILVGQPVVAGQRSMPQL
jgi:ribosomal protein L21